jgi:hypothetical protein
MSSGKVQPETKYEVEDIIKMRMWQDQRRYLLKWKGYPESENTWESEQNLVDDGCETLILEFLARKRAEKAAMKLKLPPTPPVSAFLPESRPPPPPNRPAKPAPRDYKRS